MSLQFNFKRDIRDAIHLGLQPEDLFVASPYSTLQPLLSRFFPQQDLTSKKEVKVGFTGGLFSILSITSFGYFFFKRKKLSRCIPIFSVISLAGLILSFGPVLHLFRQTIHHPFPIILPYTLFYYVVPGFNGLRNAARFEMLFVLGMSTLIGIFLTEITKKWRRFNKGLLFVGLFGLLLLEFHNPDRFVQIQQQKNFPKVYTKIKQLPREAILIELPIYTWYMPHSGNELQRVYYSTMHFRRMVNGISGFSPLPWQQLVISIMKSFPSQQSIEKLKALGITHIILHKNEYNNLHDEKFVIDKTRIKSGSEMVTLLATNKNVLLIDTFEQNDYLYSIQ